MFTFRSRGNETATQSANYTPVFSFFLELKCGTISSVIQREERERVILKKSR